MIKYTVRRISVLPIVRFGLVLGGLAMVLPGLMCAGVMGAAISALHQLLDKMALSQADVFGLGQIPFDFINILGLEATQTVVTSLDEQAMTVALFVFMLNVLGGSLFIGGTVWLLGVAYNLLAAVTGGIDVELQNKS